MTAPYRRTDAIDVAGNHERRIAILEALNPESGVYKNPVMSYDMMGDGLQAFYRYGLSDYYIVEDVTIPGGIYLTTQGGGSTGDELIFGAPLGPKGSLWAFWMMYGTGPSGGRMQIELQTQPESTSVPGLFQEPDLTVPWVNYYNYIDCYSALPLSWNQFDINDRILPYGDGGAMLTSMIGLPSPAYGANVNAYDGGGDGSVMWYFRLKTLASVNAGNVTGNKDMWIRHLRLIRFVGMSPNADAYPDDLGMAF